MNKTLWYAVLVLLVGMAGSPAHSATIAVAAGETVFSPGNGKCSLREAIRNGETESDTSGGDCTAGTVGSNTITLAAASTYVIADQDSEHLDEQVNGLPEIHGNLIVEGSGATITRDPALSSGSACGGGGAKFRIFYVSTLGQLTLKNLTLRNGCADFPGGGAGGAIFNRGGLTLDGVTLTANQALRSGGAIHNDGDLTITRGTISSNAVLAVEAGGGAIVNRGAMQIAQSAINGNTGAGAGGGIDTGRGNATVSNSTLTGNIAEGNGGGIYSRSPTTLVINTTVVANRGLNSVAPGAGSGVFRGAGTLQLTNTLLAQQANGANCSGASGGSNNLSDDASCPSATNAAPMIGPLANNGGTTLTYALLRGSPAIDAGNAAACAAAPQNGLDQRGQPRLQGSACDIGAFEIVQYAVTYDGNGSTGGALPPAGAYPVGSTATVAANPGSLEKTGSVLAGWSTQADGGGTRYAATGSATFVTGANDVTLYAVWTLVSYSAPSPGGTGSIGVTASGGGTGCGFTMQRFIPVAGGAGSPPAGSAPPNVVFPQGLFDFAMNGCTSGSTVTFNVTYPQPLPAGTQYWKYGPTATNNAPHWYVLPAVFNGNVATFSVTDGGLGDDDFASGPNGTIIDQGGPGIPAGTAAQAIPTLGEFGLLLLAGLMAGVGALTLRRPR